MSKAAPVPPVGGAGGERHRAPYKGLVPYGENDSEFFFSRERERDVILDNFMAHRLLLVYGASGVGKSSLLRAGVAHSLREIARGNLVQCGVPELAVVVLDSWQDDPVAALKERTWEALRSLLGDRLPAPPPEDAPLAEFLVAAADCVGGELFVILDQFEEYFLYHSPSTASGSFDVEFPRVVAHTALAGGFLVSLREDALARLDRFKSAIPHLFSNRFHLDYLDRQSARDAIVKPLARYNQMHPGHRVEIEPGLVDTVLDEVEIGQVGFSDVGLAGLEAGGGRVATPYLQLVMRRLWDTEVLRGSTALRLATLTDELGGAQQIVRTHLDLSLAALSGDEQAVASEVFRHLVTPSGTKYAYSISDLADLTHRPAEAVTPVLRSLARPEIRILRNLGPPPGVSGREWDRYQIFHDVLAPAVLNWRRRYEERRAKEETLRRQREEQERQRAELLVEQEMERLRMHRKNMTRLAVLAVGLLVAVVTAVIGLFTADHARDRAREVEMLAAREAEIAKRTDDQRLAQQVDILRSLADLEARTDSRPAQAQIALVSSQIEGSLRRAGTTVRYFQDVVNHSGVADSLRTMGFQVERGRGRFTGAPNYIACGSGTAGEDVVAIARALMSAGLPIRLIQPFPVERGRSRVIEIVHAPALNTSPSLSHEQVARQAARCGRGGVAAIPSGSMRP